MYKQNNIHFDFIKIETKESNILSCANK